MRASAASNSASLTRKAKCRGWKSVESAKSRVTPLAVLTGTKWPHSGPASRFKMSARKLAEAHLSFAGMIVWLSSTLIFFLLCKDETTSSYFKTCLRSAGSAHPVGEPRQRVRGVAEHVFDDHATPEIMADRV